MRSLIVLLVALPLLVLTCSDKKPSGPIVTDDLIPPARITTIWICDSAPTWADLCWYAVGDDSLTGKAHTYDIRLSQSPIAESNFSSCQAVEQALEPRAPKVGERLRITDLDSSVVYFVAIKTSDDAGNWSAMSVVAHINKTDTVGPFAIEDLSGEVTQDTSIVLRWTAPADQNSTGALWKYDIRYFGEPIRDDNWESALPLAMTVPHSPNSAESLLVDWPTTDTILYFAVRSEDLFRNYSDLSNMIQLRLPGIDTVIVPPDTTDSMYVVWEVTYTDLPGQKPKSMAETNNGDILVLAEAAIPSSSKKDLIVTKIDSSGNLLWSITVGGQQLNVAVDIEATDLGGGVVFGGSDSYLGTGHGYVAELGAGGELLREFFISIDGGIAAGATCKDGGYVVSGTSDGAFLMKLDANGVSQWSKYHFQDNICLRENDSPLPAFAIGGDVCVASWGNILFGLNLAYSDDISGGNCDFQFSHMTIVGYDNTASLVSDFELYKDYFFIPTVDEIVELSDGRLIGLVRVGQGAELFCHTADGGRVYTYVSQGLSCESDRPIGAVANSPRVVLVGTKREVENLSNDFCAQLINGQGILEREMIWGQTAVSESSPITSTLCDGHVLVVGLRPVGNSGPKLVISKLKLLPQ